MLDTTKLSVMREHLRKTFAMTDAQLDNWLKGLIEEREVNSKPLHSEFEELRLFRDALKQEISKTTSQ